MTRGLFLISIIFVIAFCQPISASVIPGEKFFQDGKRAFEEKKYSKAENYFRLANETGFESARLHHAWGSTLYHMQQYAAAKVQFEAAARDPSFLQLARFNLGLVALKQQDTSEADRLFRLAYHDSQSDAVARLAGEMLRRMQLEASDMEVQSNSVGYFSSRIGYDGRTYNTAVDQSASSDVFLELNLYASKRFSKLANSGPVISGNIYNIQQKENIDNEISMALLDMGYDGEINDWGIYTGFEYNRTWLAGKDYINVWGGKLKLEHVLFSQSKFQFQSSYDWTDVIDKAYQYAEGVTWNSRLQIRNEVDSGYFYSQYEIEFNQKGERISAGNYYNYSPSRQLIRVKYQSKSHNKWRWSVDASYRYSRYQKKHVIDAISKYRIEKRTQVIGKVAYGLTRHLSITADAGYTDNQSSWEQYGYTRPVAAMGVEWLTY